MARVEQDPNGIGSLKDIQTLINDKQGIINSLLKNKFIDLADEQIIWTSPLANDNFAEYRDDDFLRKVDLDPNQIMLNNFWPLNGPQWDALAKTNANQIILVEAKANIPELKSAGTNARSTSKEQIELALSNTKNYLRVDDNIEWTNTYYQYANRIAHLYFLREVCRKETFLINIYFVNDTNVNGPQKRQEWESAINILHNELKLPKSHRLSNYMAEFFIDVNDLL